MRLPRPWPALQTDLSFLRRLAAALALLLCAHGALAQDFPALRIEAVRAAGWNDTRPPEDGWEPVAALPDNWADRWSGFDGVAWYRLRWEQPAEPRETGLLLHYLNMAGAVYLNGTPIDRARQRPRRRARAHAPCARRAARGGHPHHDPAAPRAVRRRRGRGRGLPHRLPRAVARGEPAGGARRFRPDISVGCAGCSASALS